uniref:Uncharacterized protein n=1 Tax=Macaca fascicularis TaxID=9541 RepID=A0A2K5V743_MACFA
FYKQETETEKEAVIVQGDFPPSPTSLSSSGAPRRPEDPGSPVYSVPPALYPKPWLGAQPATVVTPGVNVTLRCRAPQPAWRFGLFKLGEIGPPLFRDVSSELAEFFLEEVTPAQGGSYHCCYRRPDWRLGVWSQPSDPLELLVTAAAAVAGGAALAGGGSRRQRPALRRPPAEHELRAVPRGRGGLLQYRDSARPWLTSRCWAPAPRHLQLLLPHASAPRLQRSEALVISWEDSSSSDYTRGNLVRLGLAGLVLISLGALVTFDWRSQSRAPAGVRP